MVVKANGSGCSVMPDVSAGLAQAFAKDPQHNKFKGHYD